MKFPVVVNNRSRLMIYDDGLINEIGELDGELLRVAVDSAGKSDLKWIIDANGFFYQLEALGMLPLNWVQRLGLKRRRMEYRVFPPVTLKVAEVMRKIEGLSNPSADFNNVEDLLARLKILDPGEVWNSKQMHSYLYGCDLEVVPDD